MKYCLITTFSLLTIATSLNAADAINLYYRDTKGVLHHADIATPANLVDVYKTTPNIFGHCGVTMDGKYTVGETVVNKREYDIALAAQALQIDGRYMGIGRHRTGSDDGPQTKVSYERNLAFLAKARIEEEKRIKKLTNPRRCSIL